VRFASAIRKAPLDHHVKGKLAHDLLAAAIVPLSLDEAGQL
jgi:hypothetical protein